MLVPGSNILNLALMVIAKQQFNWYPFANRLDQPNGQYLSVYNTPVSLLGSVQAVSRNLYQEYGLDFDKYYLHFFVSQNVIDVTRDVSGDVIVFEGNTYQCLSITPWFGIDGWVEIVAVQIQNIPLVTDIIPPRGGNYTTGFSFDFTIVYNQNVVVTGVPYIALSPVGSGIINGNATYQSGSGTNQLIFSYTVQSGDASIGIIATPPLGLPMNASMTNGAGTVPANTGYIAPDLSLIVLNL